MGPAGSLPHSEGIAYKPPCGMFAVHRSYLRIQQTLEALDIFRAAARLLIFPLTEMLHQTTF
jgi:hypothetical protein